MTCSSISFFLILRSIPKKMSKVPLYLLTHFFSVHHAEPFNKVHLNAVVGFCISLVLFLVSYYRKFLLSSLSAQLFLATSFSHRVSSTSLFFCPERHPRPHQPLPYFAEPPG